MPLKRKKTLWRGKMDTKKGNEEVCERKMKSTSIHLQKRAKPKLERDREELRELGRELSAKAYRSRVVSC